MYPPAADFARSERSARRTAVPGPGRGLRGEQSPVPERPPVILHVDMDAFFAAVEQRDDPALRGKPILVGGSGKRGVVTTASYEARPFGCRSAMPMAQALRLCPHAIVVPGRYHVYSEISRQVRAILDRFSPDVEPVSVDEAYVDLTNVPAWSARPAAAAREIKRLIAAETRLTASVGVSDSKFLAKVASDMNKPDGLAVLMRADARRVLGPMSVGVLWGVGKVSVERLAELNIRTVDDLLAFDERELERRFGESARSWRAMALGEDRRAIRTDRIARSIGKERTFSDDIGDPERLRSILMDELEHAARNLRADGLRCRRIALKLRRPDFTTYSRSSVLPEPTDSTPVLWAAARALLDAFLGNRHTPLRLLGVRLEDLSMPGQLGLFDQQPLTQRTGRIDTVADQIARKFGDRAIGRATGVNARKRGDGGRTNLGGPGDDVGA